MSDAYIFKAFFAVVRYVIEYEATHFCVSFAFCMVM